MQSKVCIRTNNLSKDKGSIKLYNKDDSNEGGTFNEEDDHFADKSLHMPMLTGKMRAITTKDVNKEDDMREQDSAKAKESEVPKTNRRGLSQRSLSRTEKSFFNHLCG